MTPSYALGLCFIFLVSVIWSIASIVVQYLYHDEDFNSPFLLTYIGTSLFLLFLPTRLLWERRIQLRQFCCCCCTNKTNNNDHPQEEEELEMEIIPWRTTRPRGTYQNLPSSVDETLSPSVAIIPSSKDEVDTGQDDDYCENHSSDMDEKTISSRNVHHGGLLDDSSPSTLTIAEGGLSSPTTTPAAASHPTHHATMILSHEQHLKIACKIAPVWFVANWAYNTSLAYTSITSSTVLASMGSLFTFLFAVAWGDECFTLYKISGVLLGITGSILTAWHDVNGTSDTDDDMALLWNNNVTNTAATTAGHLGTPPHHTTPSGASSSAFDGHAVWGDMIGVVSAVGYGTYTVMIRVLCPHDERCMSMQLMLGYIGLLNALFLSPIAIHIILLSSNSNNNDDTNNNSSSSTTEQLTWMVFGFLVAKGLLDNVLSDYLWARAVVLTSATVATVGLGLTIPLAFVSDWMLGHGDDVVSLHSILGALAVLSGFVLVNLGGEENNNNNNGGGGSTGALEHAAAD